MAQIQNQSLDAKKLLSAYTNSLFKAFVEGQRSDAKRMFAELDKGNVIHLLRITFDEGHNLDIGLTLDSSEFRGKLNFSAFRNSVTALAAQISAELSAENEVFLLTSDDGKETLFKIAGFTEEDKQLNAMMMSSSQPGPGQVNLKLMYIDPDQFQQDPAQA